MYYLRQQESAAKQKLGQVVEVFNNVGFKVLVISKYK
jgi:hypothetical protein